MVDVPSTELYPPLIKSSAQRMMIKRPITHYCRIPLLLSMKIPVGRNAYEDIENNSKLGVFLRLAEATFNFSPKHLNYLFAHMLETCRTHELWMLADSRPIRFSLYEFERITGLDCGMLDKDATITEGAEWEEMGFPPNDGPTLAELEKAINECHDWSLDKRKMICRLMILFVAIFGLHHNSRIPVLYAKMVMDPERFERQPWGRIAFDVLVKSFPKADQDISSYNLHGFVYVLQIWAFEHIPQFGNMLGGKRRGDIPLLSWAGRKSRGIEMEDVYGADMKANADGKVIHFTPKAYNEIYPFWEGDEFDPKLDRMIRHILEGKLDETFWERTVNKKGHDRLSDSGGSKKVKEKDVRKRNERNERNERYDCGVSKKGKSSAYEHFNAPLDITLEEYREEAKWRRQGVVNQAMVLETMQGLKQSIDGMRSDRVDHSDRLDRLEQAQRQQTERITKLEEKSAYDTVIQNRLLALEESMASRILKIEDVTAQHSHVNERLLKMLDCYMAPPQLTLEGKGKSSEVGASKSDVNAAEVQDPEAEEEGVRKSLIDYD